MKKYNLDKINKDMARIEAAVHFFALLIIAIGIVMLNTGCVQERYDQNSKQVTIHPDTQPYVDAFILAGKINNKKIEINDLIIEFKPDTFFKSTTEIGRCSRCYGNRICTPEIRIRRSWWDKTTTSKLNKREVIFHELGHFILQLDHKNTKDLAGYPYSVMNKTQIGDNIYNETTINSYDTELFTGHNPTTIGEK